MTRTLQRRILLGLALPFAGIVAANVSMVALNRASQSEIAERAQFIQQSVALERLNQEIIRALAELAVRNQDKDVTALLNANGVTFTASAPAPAAPAPAGKGK
ncbi:MAG TPA: hypothetical protein PKC20_19285 [Burkholderiaceae bacterium]|nr:hypothetical protein [Burkholderiaceae bacterium]